MLLGVGTAAVLAGSESRLAPGTAIAGVDVGGMEGSAAVARLTGLSRAVEHRPVAEEEAHAGHFGWAGGFRV